MLCSFYIFYVIDDTPFAYKDTFKTSLYHILALFKVAFTKYLQSKFNKINEKININKHIITAYESSQKDIILKAFKFINQFVETQLEVENNQEKTTEEMIKFLIKRSHYEKIRDSLEDLHISATDIEDIVLEDGDEIIQIDNSVD
jgi:hypothetical protein